MSLRVTSALILFVCLPAVVAFAWLYSGRYPIGADVPHFQLTTSLLTLLREKSIARAARDIVPPNDLDTPARLLAGGADYNEMCSQCHLKPGKVQSDFSLGLYPAPPNLTTARPATETPVKKQKKRFWVIKHGIKASGMPAWKYGHDDERIWNMVAFLDRLPELSADQYQVLTARIKHSTSHHH